MSNSERRKERRLQEKLERKKMDKQAREAANSKPPVTPVNPENVRFYIDDILRCGGHMLFIVPDGAKDTIESIKKYGIENVTDMMGTNSNQITEFLDRILCGEQKIVGAFNSGSLQHFFVRISTPKFGSLSSFTIVPFSVLIEMDRENNIQQVVELIGVNESQDIIVNPVFVRSPIVEGNTSYMFTGYSNNLQKIHGDDHKNVENGILTVYGNFVNGK